MIVVASCRDRLFPARLARRSSALMRARVQASGGARWAAMAVVAKTFALTNPAELGPSAEWIPRMRI
jgi:hypothetical protein